MYSFVKEWHEGEWMGKLLWNVFWDYEFALIVNFNKIWTFNWKTFVVLPSSIVKSDRLWNPETLEFIESGGVIL